MVAEKLRPLGSEERFLIRELSARVRRRGGELYPKDSSTIALVPGFAAACVDDAGKDHWFLWVAYKAKKRSGPQTGWTRFSRRPEGMLHILAKHWLPEAVMALRLAPKTELEIFLNNNKDKVGP